MCFLLPLLGPQYWLRYNERPKMMYRHLQNRTFLNYTPMWTKYLNFEANMLS